jgi:hypothetical protein
MFASSGAKSSAGRPEAGSRPIENAKTRKSENAKGTTFTTETQRTQRRTGDFRGSGALAGTSHSNLQVFIAFLCVLSVSSVSAVKMASFVPRSSRPFSFLIGGRQAIANSVVKAFPFVPSPRGYPVFALSCFRSLNLSEIDGERI